MEEVNSPARKREIALVIKDDYTKKFSSCKKYYLFFFDFSTVPSLLEFICVRVTQRVSEFNRKEMKIKVV